MVKLKSELIELLDSSNFFSRKRSCSTPDELRKYVIYNLRKSALSGVNTAVIDKFDCNVENWIEVIQDFCKENNISCTPISEEINNSIVVNYVFLHWYATRADFS